MKNSIKVIFVIFFVLIGLISLCSISYAETTGMVDEDASSELLEMKESTKSKIDGYVEQYGSKTYGFAAYILNGARIFSIPLCFLGIALGAVYQYVIGIRKLDLRDRGFRLIISFVTILLICQVLPLVFTIVVRGWRG